VRSPISSARRAARRRAVNEAIISGFFDIITPFFTDYPPKAKGSEQIRNCR